MICKSCLGHGTMVQYENDVVDCPKCEGFGQISFEPEVAWTDLDESDKEKYRAKVGELFFDLLWCSRVWEAWSVGTMGQDDFHHVLEDDEFVEEKAEALYIIAMEAIHDVKDNCKMRKPAKL